MSGSGIVTILVLMLGSACCTFSYSASRADRGGIKSTGVTAPAVSDEDVRALHRMAARKLRDQGLEEAASWHERMAAGPGGDVSGDASVDASTGASTGVSPVPASRPSPESPLANSAAEAL